MSKITGIDARIRAVEERFFDIPQGEIWPLLIKLRDKHGLPAPSPLMDGKAVTLEVFQLMKLDAGIKETTT
jgi:hypothetical protein